jgi:hypothetical protein
VLLGALNLLPTEGSRMSRFGALVTVLQLRKQLSSGGDDESHGRRGA